MALQFDNIDDAVDLGAFDVSSGLSALTLMCWLQPQSLNDDRLLSKANGTSTANHWWTLQLPSGTLRTRLKTGGTTVETSGGSFALNEWHHAAMIYNGTTTRLFKDGVQVASNSQTGTVDQDATVGVRIADNPVGDRFFDGLIEDVRIYERALTDDELTTIVALKGLDTIDTNLVHRWILNDAADGVAASGAGSVKDSVGSVDGTPISSPIYRGTILKTRKRVI